MGIWAFGGCHNRRSGSRALGLFCAEMVTLAASALVHLGIYRGNAISRLEFKQGDADALRGMHCLFLPGNVFVERRSQDWIVLGRNRLRIFVGVGDRFGTAFRRAE